MLEHILKSGEILSKDQSVFQNRTQEIKKLQEEFDTLNEKIKVHSSRLQSLYIPFLNQFQDLKIQQVLLLADCMDRMKWAKHQKKQLTQVIIQECISVLEKDPGHKEIAILYKTLSGVSFEINHTSSQEGRYDHNPFGTFFDSETKKDDADIPDWEKQKESAKQQRLAKKKEQQEKVENLSLKEIYRNLLKAYHPDKEQDEEKKAEKTAVTQQIIKAYQREDLYSLLRFEIELLENTKDRLASIATDKLKTYNNLLQENKKALEDKIAALKSDHSELYKNMCAPNSNADRYLRKTKKELSQELENFKKQLLHLRGNSEFVSVFVESYLNDAVQRFYF